MPGSIHPNAPLVALEVVDPQMISERGFRVDLGDGIAIQLTVTAIVARPGARFTDQRIHVRKPTNQEINQTLGDLASRRCLE
jgi:hypothetical protein